MAAHFPVALAHDYLTQRGGAERVAAIMAEAFPGAPLFTTLYQTDATFDEFRGIDVRPSVLNRIGYFRNNHRAALPFYAPVVSQMKIDADVLLASSSGWAHGMQCTGRKVVYCHAPARWLYQSERYLGASDGSLPHRLKRGVWQAALSLLAPPLRSWDRKRAETADRYLVNSSLIQRMVAEVYGIEAEFLPPPPALNPRGDVEAVGELTQPFVLCVARLLPYKNVDAVISAVKQIDGLNLAVVGRGPDAGRLTDLIAGDPSVRLLGGVTEEALRWLYTNCAGLVAASYEDFGLTPLEAASFGRPTAALHHGGYLDTIEPGVSGVFFEDPAATSIRDGVLEMLQRPWRQDDIEKHADVFGKARFCERLQNVIADLT